jgi:hypothetical protein
MARFTVPALLVAGILGLAAATPAVANHTTEVNASAVTLGPGGSLSVSGTIDCTTGYFWGVTSVVRQKSGKFFNEGLGGAGGTCSTDGPEPFITNLFFGSGPFKSGRVVVETFADVCNPDPEIFECASDAELKEMRVRK